MAVGVVLLSGGCRTRRVSPFADSEPPSEPVAQGPSIEPGYLLDVDVRLEVKRGHSTRAISPLIYGANFSYEQAAAQRWGAIRAGGNRLTAFNWENNASNAGADYLYQNDGLAGETDEAGIGACLALDAAATVHAATILTLSMSDYVSADKAGGGDVRSSGPNYLRTRFKENKPRKPGPFASVPDRSDPYVYQDEYVAFVRAARPAARIIWSLDNEPDLWSHTHPEVFPKPVTYADLWTRTVAYASAVKDACPSCEVSGPASYGYNGFVSLQDASDANGRPFLAWYLQQAHAAEAAQKRRILDYLDVHWYPEVTAGDERIVTNSSTSKIVEARVQAPRSLWDPTFTEQSWIGRKVDGPIRLIPWLKGLIAEHYPGTKLAVTEWNYGGGAHISGALAVADVLGIFGRYGVDAASYWPLGDETYAFAAFRMYRNYDGRGAAFGDVSLEAASSDVATATVYASCDRDNPQRLTIIAINKANVPKVAGLQISDDKIFMRARTFVLGEEAPAPRNGPELVPAAMNAFRYLMPPHSITLIVPSE